MSNRAWVTLATNDSYGLGALVLAHSLRRVGSTHSTVVLITPSVTDAMRDRLRAIFTEVVTVDVLDSRDAAHLALLQRPELGITFTKIHCWGLTQYEKCVFLDADTLVVQNCDELFDREELSAAPDVGWPDCFNSGVFVYQPSSETFDALIKFAQERGSFDGGDQGLLNSFFSDWARGDINKHLPYLYNVTSAAFYSYLPALKHYGQDLKIIHFIGAAKPWLQPYNWESRSVSAPDHLRELLQLWWDLFVGQVHQQLDSSMCNLISNYTAESIPAVGGNHIGLHFAESSKPIHFHTEPRSEQFTMFSKHSQQEISVSEVEDVEVEAPAEPPADVARHYAPRPDPDSQFRWHHPDSLVHQEAEDKPDFTDFYDPWQHYRGNIPPNPDLEATDDRQAVRDYAWEYRAPAQNANVWQQPPGHRRDSDWHNEPHDHHHTHSPDHRDHQGDHSHIHTHGHPDEHHGWHREHEAGPISTSHDHSQHHYSGHENFHGQHEAGLFSTNHDHSQRHHSEHEHLHGHTHTQYPHDHHHDHTDHPYHDHSHSDQSHRHDSSNDPQPHKGFGHTQVDVTNSRLHIVHHVHIDYGNTPNGENREDNVPVATKDMNGDASESESCHDHEDIKPRHPYDNYYLRHRAAIDPYGRKICSHEIPPPSPSPPPESFVSLDSEEEVDEAAVENQSGVAGTLARVVPGAAARDALDELSRRQGWEAGNIDYMGADSFDNIWAKISQTLNRPKEPSPPKQSPPRDAPKQPSPPKEPAPKQPSPPKEAPAEMKPAEVPAEAKPAEAPAAAPVETPAAEPIAEAAGKPTPVSPAAEAPAPAQAAPVEAPAPAPALEASVVAAVAPAPAEAAPPAASAAEAPKEEKTDKPEVPPTPPATPKSTPEPSTPVGEVPAAVEALLAQAAPSPASDRPAPDSPAPTAVAPDSLAPAAKVPASPAPAADSPASPAPAAEAPASPAPGAQALASTAPAAQAPASPAPAAQAPASPAPAAEAPASPVARTPEKALDASAASTDSPPLANTPSKEEAPVEPAAKSEERSRRKPAEKLQLSPPGAGPALAAAATPDSELEDAAALAHAIIASELALPAPSPPSVSLAQIGVRPKGKSTAAQIESSVPAPQGQVSASAEAAVSPKAEAPTTHSAEAPATPSAEAPATPSAEAPATPSAEAPATPSAEAPATPSAEAPATPSAELPATPSAEAPVTPSAEALVTPSAEAPATSSAEAAAKDAPKKKIVKKVVKKEGDAPVPPPRKKEKKPKEK